MSYVKPLKTLIRPGMASACATSLPDRRLTRRDFLRVSLGGTGTFILFPSAYGAEQQSDPNCAQSVCAEVTDVAAEGLKIISNIDLFNPSVNDAIDRGSPAQIVSATSKVTSAVVASNAYWTQRDSFTRFVQSSASNAAKANINEAIRKFSKDELSAAIRRANRAIESRNFDALFRDPILGPIVSAGRRGVGENLTRLKATHKALRDRLQLLKNKSSARTVREAEIRRLKGLLTDAQIDRLTQRFPDISEIQRLKKIPPPLPQPSLDPRVNPVVPPVTPPGVDQPGMQRPGLRQPSQPIPGPQSKSFLDGLSNFLSGQNSPASHSSGLLGDSIVSKILGVQPAQAQTGVGETIAIVGVVIIGVIVVAAVACLASQAMINDCVKSTNEQASDNYQQCLTSAERQWNRRRQTAQRAWEQCRADGEWFCDLGYSTALLQADAQLFAANLACELA